MIEGEAKMAREAWGLSMDASDYAHSDVMSLHHKRQVQLTKTLRLLKGLQTQMVEFQSLLSIMGYSQLAYCIDHLFCLATQYRYFVQAMIDEGVTAALAARDATRNGNDSHLRNTGVTNGCEVVVNAPTRTS
ncbi:hypothetical protein Tco_0908540 [Tanacetum coccineum]|uniref:Gamma-tubulin complex component n=1 Tax=Tanacetum coccineum TaxID=301880 RepID=A0ABQ5CMM6_9ASTR